MRDDRIRTLAEAALTIALFAVLDSFNIRLPFNFAGGTISLVMLPLIVFSLLRGPRFGLLVGALCGMVDLAFNPYLLNAAQVILDYPVAYALVGLSGLPAFALSAPATKKPTRATLITLAAATLGVAGRLLAATLSGVIFFAENAPATQNVWLYSLVYNLSYLLPSLLAVAGLAAIAVPVLRSLLNAKQGSLTTNA